MSKELTRHQKRDMAQALYVSGVTVQKELAVRVGVTEKTISKWVNDGNWEQLRMNIPLVKHQQLQKMYKEFERFNQHIENKPDGKQWATKAESDARTQLIRAIEVLEGEAGVKDIIEVCQKLIKYTMQIDEKLGRDLIPLCDSFLRSQIK
jgi:transposase